MAPDAANGWGLHREDGQDQCKEGIMGYNDDCFGDSEDFVDLDCLQLDAGDASDSVDGSRMGMVDCVHSGWTDEMHSSYLDTMEATFVKKMYDKEYCALDLCGESPREQDSQDPDTAESKLSYPSPFTEFKVWQEGNWQKLPDFNKAKKAVFTTISQNPWVQRLRRLPPGQEQGASRNPLNASTTILEQKETPRSMHHVAGDLAKFDHFLGERLNVWHCRQQHGREVAMKSCIDRKLIFGKSQPYVFPIEAAERAVEDTSLVERALIRDKSEPPHMEEDIADENRGPKRRKGDIHGGCSLYNDQVVPMLGCRSVQQTGVPKISKVVASMNRMLEPHNPVNSLQETQRPRLACPRGKKKLV